MPLGRRLAWRWPMMRKRRGPGLRRSIGTGVTTPLAMSFVRMRPDHRDRDVDLAHESAGPSRRTLPVRPSRARLEPLLPTVERGPARPDGAGRLLGREPARAGAPPAFERVSPDGCEL